VRGRSVAVVLGVAVAGVLRGRGLRWGARHDEVRSVLPGDELLDRYDLSATRAITVRAAPERVWPWVAQLGQGRGGFYSYDALENLAGCQIHSANEVVEEWQDVAVGDAFHLHPEVRLTVARVDPGRALVVRGGVSMGRTAPPYDFVWAFVVRPAADGTTRLVVRERYAYAHRWVALLCEPVEVVSLVMGRRMMLGIRDRAESQRAAPHVGRSGSSHSADRSITD
jgi:hypothetical protein